MALIGTRRVLLARRPSFVDPSSVPGLAFWFKAQTEAYADNDPVSPATDKSGNGRNATQGTAANKPTFKTNIVNGKSVYRFDGTNDNLQTGLFTLSQPCTLFLVSKKRLNDSVQQIVMDDSDNTGNTIYHAASSNNTSMYAGGSVVAVSPTVTNFNVYVAVFDGASSVFYLNGAGVAGDAGNRANDKIVLGCRAITPDQHFDGDIAECGGYSTALSAADRVSLTTYLGSQHGITVV